MSQENVELTRRCMDALNRRDLEDFLSFMDEEVRSVPRIVALEGDLHGHEGIRLWWQAWFEAFPDYRIEVVDIQDLDVAVLTALRAVGHGAGSTVPVLDVLWHVSRWEGGKCAWWQTANSEAEALEAVGLSESSR